LSVGKPGDFMVPSPHMDVAVAADGTVWIANPGNHRVEGYNREGQLQKVWGRFGTQVDAFFGCCNPSDFALLSDGSFVTAEKGLARVKQYDSDGKFQCVVATPQAFAENMMGLDVATDSTGKLYVLEPGTKVVRVFGKIQ
jgi:hypothetical protein